MGVPASCVWICAGSKTISTSVGVAPPREEQADNIRLDRSSKAASLIVKVLNIAITLSC
jgi:hypothetical protein